MNEYGYLDITPNDERWYDLEDLPNEYFEWIPYAVGYYMISNYSRVKSIGRHGCRNVNIDKILTPLLKKDGYYQTVLHIKGKHYYKRINRLMGETFLPNPDKLPIVDHKDNNKLNNCLYNLEWVTLLENARRYYENYFVSTNKGRGQIKPKAVCECYGDGDIIKVYHSTVEASKEIYGTKSKRGGICKACRTGKKYLGHYWKYYDGDDIK